VQVHTRVVDRIRIEIEPSEFGYHEDYDALIEDLHEQGWRAVIVEESHGFGSEGAAPTSPPVLFHTVGVHIAEHVSDVTLDMITAALVRRLRRPPVRPGRVRQAIIFDASHDVLLVVELNNCP
jgi:hypothetical protein